MGSVTRNKISTDVHSKQIAVNRNNLLKLHITVHNNNLTVQNENNYQPNSA
jgi:hypothetical protein